MLIGVDYGGDMSPPLFIICILSPPLLKMCKPIATEKIPTYSTETVKSKSCDRRAGWHHHSMHTGSARSGKKEVPVLSDRLGTKFGTDNFLLDWPTTGTTATGGGVRDCWWGGRGWGGRDSGGYMVIVPTTSKTKVTPLVMLEWWK